MPKFPEPPSVSELARVRPAIRTLAKGAELWRVYFRGGPHPTLWNRFRSFGPTSSRFDHHTLPARVQRRQILYAAENGPTCVAEAFQDARFIDRSAGSPWLVAFELARAVKLLDLTGAWPTRAGASMSLCSGPRPRARRWSQAIFAAYPEVEGLIYPSSMNANEPCVALYERARSALPAHPTFHRALVDPSLLTPFRDAARRFGYGLA